MEFKLFDKPDYAAGRPGDAAWYKDRAVSDHLHEEGMHRRRLLEAADLIESAIQRDASIADFGAGNGGLLHELRERGYKKSCGYDMSPLAVNYACSIYEENVKLYDVVEGYPEAGFCTILTEFLEHIVSPHNLLRDLHFANGERCQRVVASSPCNENPNSFYEYHLWAWTGDSFAHMFERAGWKVLRHYARADCNTQFVLAERR